MRALIATFLILTGPARLAPPAGCPMDPGARASDAAGHHGHGSLADFAAGSHDAGPSVPKGPATPSACRMHLVCGPSLNVGATRLVARGAVWHTAAPIFRRSAAILDLSKDPPPPRLSA